MRDAEVRMRQLMAGANGFTHDPKFFRQYGGVILLLSSPTRSMPQDFANVIAAALKEGQSLIVLQWKRDARAGHLNFENIFYPNFGISINGASRISSDRAGVRVPRILRQPFDVECIGFAR